MNVETLRHVTDVLDADFAKANLLKLLTRVEESYQQSVQTPNAETLQAFEAARVNLVNAAAAHEATQLSAGQLAALEKMHAADLAGIGLIDRVNGILAAGVTPASVTTALQELKARLQAFTELVRRIRADLDSMGIKYRADTESPNDADVEILLPSAVFDGSLGGLADETERLNNALLPIVEIATGSRPVLRIRSVSTGSLELLLAIAPAAALAILQVVSDLTKMIVTYMELKKARLELEKANAPKESTDLLRAWEVRQLEERQDRLRDELLRRIENEGRRNELDNELRLGLKYLANRIDRNMRVTVQLPSPTAPADPETDAGSTAATDAAVRKQIADLTAELAALPKWQEPALALLPEPAKAAEVPEAPAEESQPPGGS
jgi:hypothetical protein